MKYFNRLIIIISLVSIVFSGCDSLLDVESDQFLNTDEHKLNSPNDTLYSMLGILSQLQKVRHKYLVLGEVRGDLMDITDNADTYLRQISSFDVANDNPYTKVSDYYAVINNCNYLIQNIDTSIVSRGEKVMYKEFAAAKAIRAWVYMQIALNFRTAIYYDYPVLTVSDSQVQKGDSIYTLSQLADVLIKDIEPWKDVDYPGAVGLGDISTSKMFFPIRMILGDLYLWKGEYEKAALEYRNLMYKGDFLIPNNAYRRIWTVTNSVFVSKATNMFFYSAFNLYVNGEINKEHITIISGSNEFGRKDDLREIIYNYSLKPSTVAINNWTSQTYYHTANLVNFGDLRGEDESYYKYTFSSNTSANQDMYYIYKYPLSKNTSSIITYRAGLLYLRYAEAVNRAGKPNLAFAVLKNGLSSFTINDRLLVPAKEVGNPLPVYMNFIDPRSGGFNNNIGIHARGCGNTNLATDYKIPALDDLQDSIEYVEDKIIEELALETAFEGNRFQDLMRISLRRGGTAYLDSMVARKKPELEGILKNINSWYLPAN